MRAFYTRLGVAMKALTERQRSILAFLHESIAKLGRPPTHQEIGARFGFSKGGAGSDHLLSLERKGLIERETGLRTLRLTDAAYAVLKEPTPTEMRVAVQRAERYRGLLIRCWAGFTQLAPQSPLLAEIRDELGIDERMSTATATTTTTTNTESA